MSTLMPEQVAVDDRSTEAILQVIRTQLLPHAETSLQLTHYDQPIDERRYYYCGDNATASVMQDDRGLELHLASLPVIAYGSTRVQPLELQLRYTHNTNGLGFSALHTVGALAVTTSSIHSARHQRYQPKLWPDGGYSLELLDEPDGPSLDQATIGRLAMFAATMAGRTLVLAKRRLS